MENRAARQVMKTQVLVIGGERWRGDRSDRPASFFGRNMTLGLPLLASLDAHGRQVTRGQSQEPVDRHIGGWEKFQDLMCAKLDGRAVDFIIFTIVAG
jgi:hypothetical protein